MNKISNEKVTGFTTKKMQVGRYIINCLHNDFNLIFDS